MHSLERPDDLESRRGSLQSMTDEELHDRFWSLTDQIIEPLVEEARTHTSPSIERSVLLRMGFSSVEANQLVAQMQKRELLGRGAGRLVLELAKSQQISVRATGEALLQGHHWQALEG